MMFNYDSLDFNYNSSCWLWVGPFGNDYIHDDIIIQDDVDNNYNCYSSSSL